MSLAAKSKAITELSDNLNSNKWFWRTSAMEVSKREGGSLIRLRNMDSIPPWPELYASSGLNMVSDKLTLGAMCRLFLSKRPRLFLTKVCPNLNAAVENSLETAGLSFLINKHN